MECPICGQNFLKRNGEYVADEDSTRFNCKYCGKFSLTNSLMASLSSLLREKRDASQKLSHVIRKAYKADSFLHLNLDTANAILLKPLPRPREQADLLIQWLANNSPGIGETFELGFESHGAIVGAKSKDGFSMLVNHLIEKGLVKRPPNKGNMVSQLTISVALSFDGWEYFENLKLGEVSYRKAFMAMKFGDPTLNSMLENVFKPAASRAGFDLLKLDDRPRAGLIDDRMRVEIRASDFLIADLTHDNFGAYWEAGYAEGLGKPVIYTCERSKFESGKTHFDTNHHLTILWDINSGPDVSNQLTETIRATLPHISRLVD